MGIEPTRRTAARVLPIWRLMNLGTPRSFAELNESCAMSPVSIIVSWPSCRTRYVTRTRPTPSSPIATATTSSTKPPGRIWWTSRRWVSWNALKLGASTASTRPLASANDFLDHDATCPWSHHRAGAEDHAVGANVAAHQPCGTNPEWLPSMAPRRQKGQGTATPAHEGSPVFTGFPGWHARENSNPQPSDP